VAEKLFGKLQIEHRDGKVISLQRPWRRVRMTELVEERTGWRFQQKPLEMSDLKYSDIGGKQLALRGKSPAEQLVEVYEKLVEPTLIDPCFVTHVPSVIIPLARKNAADPFFADVYELAINGQEISPGYSELNDPDVQAQNFAHQVGDDAEKQKTDDDFLTALRYGMPPAGGMGMGIDRLVMMLTGAESIRDVVLFPLMRPTGEARE
jgi:lysyl-tRNA synthetase class 2